jgi:hypothetical protein
MAYKRHGFIDPSIIRIGIIKPFSARASDRPERPLNAL